MVITMEDRMWRRALSIGSGRKDQICKERMQGAIYSLNEEIGVMS